MGILSNLVHSHSGRSMRSESGASSGASSSGDPERRSSSVRSLAVAPELEEIKRVLEDIGWGKLFDALVEEFDTLDKCYALTHEDLGRVGVQKFGQRHAIVKAFHEHAELRERRASSS